MGKAAGRTQQRVLEHQQLRLQQRADRLLDEESRQQGRAATAVPKKANVFPLLNSSFHFIHILYS